MGAQIRKLANPGIKKVGMAFSGMTCGGSQMRRSAVLAHKSMKVQNVCSAIFSIIIYLNRFDIMEVA